VCVYVWEQAHANPPNFQLHIQSHIITQCSSRLDGPNPTASSPFIPDGATSPLPFRPYFLALYEFQKSSSFHRILDILVSLLRRFVGFPISFNDIPVSFKRRHRHVSSWVLIVNRKITAVSMNNAVSRNVTSCGSCKNRLFGETKLFHHQNYKNRWTRNNVRRNFFPACVRC
jgi:hypothetical protein